MVVLKKHHFVYLRKAPTKDDIDKHPYHYHVLEGKIFEKGGPHGPSEGIVQDDGHKGSHQPHGLDARHVEVADAPQVLW